MNDVISILLAIDLIIDERNSNSVFLKASSVKRLDTGWGGRDRTYECRNQNPVPYHLATPQFYYKDLYIGCLSNPRATKPFISAGI